MKTAQVVRLAILATIGIGLAATEHYPSLVAYRPGHRPGWLGCLRKDWAMATDCEPVC